MALLSIWTLSSIDSTPDNLKNEVLLRHTILILLISFPSGIFALAFIFLTPFFGTELTTTEEIIISTITCTLAGYVQWLIITPYLYRKYHTSTKKTTRIINKSI